MTIDGKGLFSKVKFVGYNTILYTSSVRFHRLVFSTLIKISLVLFISLKLNPAIIVAFFSSNTNIRTVL